MGERPHTLEISPADGVTSYVGRRQRPRRGTLESCEFFIEIDETWATEHALGREMAPTLPKDLDDCVLLLGSARQGHVPALSRDHHPFSPVRYQGAHAQSRARTDDPDRTGGLRSSRPDRKHVRAGQMRYCHCGCGEIIDNLQRAQSKASMQIAD